MFPIAIFNGGINITEPDLEGEKNKNLCIRDIPADIYWAIIALKTKFRSETWIDFWKTILSAQIISKDPLIPIVVEPFERIIVQEIPPETFDGLRDLKAKLRAKTWVEFLAILANAGITVSGQVRPPADIDQQEAVP